MYLTALQDGAQEEEASVQLSVSTTVPTIDQPEWGFLIPIAFTTSAV